MAAFFVTFTSLFMVHCAVMVLLAEVTWVGIVLRKHMSWNCYGLGNLNGRPEPCRHGGAVTVPHQRGRFRPRGYKAKADTIL
jgi:hypothetical protein